MSVTASWDDETQMVLYIRLAGAWVVADLHAAHHQALSLLRESASGQSVALLYDFTASGPVPLQMQYAMARFVQENPASLRRLVYCGGREAGAVLDGQMGVLRRLIAVKIDRTTSLAEARWLAAPRKP